MKCPKCEQAGEKSTVFVGGGYTTLMYCAPFYDESGIYHDHDSNITTHSFSCSRGHQWITHSTPRCPSCDWGKDSK